MKLKQEEGFAIVIICNELKNTMDLTCYTSGQKNQHRMSSLGWGKTQYIQGKTSKY